MADFGFLSIRKLQEDTTSEYKLKTGSVNVGSDEDADIHHFGMFILPIHFVISVDVNGVASLASNSATIPTILNGKVLRKNKLQVLRPKDILMLPGLEIQYINDNFNEDKYAEKIDIVTTNKFIAHTPQINKFLKMTPSRSRSQGKTLSASITKRRSSEGLCIWQEANRSSSLWRSSSMQNRRSKSFSFDVDDALYIPLNASLSANKPIPLRRSSRTIVKPARYQNEDDINGLHTSVTSANMETLILPDNFLSPVKYEEVESCDDLQNTQELTLPIHENVTVRDKLKNCISSVNSKDDFLTIHEEDVSQGDFLDSTDCSSFTYLDCQSNSLNTEDSDLIRFSTNSINQSSKLVTKMSSVNISGVEKLPQTPALASRRISYSEAGISAIKGSSKDSFINLITPETKTESIVSKSSMQNDSIQSFSDQQEPFTLSEVDETIGDYDVSLSPKMSSSEGDVSDHSSVSLSLSRQGNGRSDVKIRQTLDDVRSLKTSLLQNDITDVGMSLRTSEIKDSGLNNHLHIEGITTHLSGTPMSQASNQNETISDSEIDSINRFEFEESKIDATPRQGKFVKVSGVENSVICSKTKQVDLEILKFSPLRRLKTSTPLKQTSLISKTPKPHSPKFLISSPEGRNLENNSEVDCVYESEEPVAETEDLCVTDEPKLSASQLIHNLDLHEVDKTLKEILHISENCTGGKELSEGESAIRTSLGVSEITYEADDLENLSSSNQNISPIKNNELSLGPNISQIFQNSTAVSSKLLLANVSSTVPTAADTANIEHNNKSVDYEGVKRLLTTPRQQVLPKNDLSDLRGVKQLLGSSEKSPKNDLCNISGVANLLKTPTVLQHSSLSEIPEEQPNDVSDVDGIDQLFNTPLVETPSKNKLSVLRSSKHTTRPLTFPKSRSTSLLQEPLVRRSIRIPMKLKNDTTKVELLGTPVQDLSQNDLKKSTISTRQIRSTRKTIRVPENGNDCIIDDEPKERNISIVSPAKLQPSTSKSRILKTPKNDLINVSGVKLLETPSDQNLNKLDETPIGDGTETGNSLEFQQLQSSCNQPKSMIMVEEIPVPDIGGYQIQDIESNDHLVENDYTRQPCSETELHEDHAVPSLDQNSSEDDLVSESPEEPLLSSPTDDNTLYSLSPGQKLRESIISDFDNLSMDSVITESKSAEKTFRLVETPKNTSTNYITDTDEQMNSVIKPTEKTPRLVKTPKNANINHSDATHSDQMLPENYFTDEEKTSVLMKTPKKNKIDVSSDGMLDTSYENLLDDQSSNVTMLPKPFSSSRKSPRLATPKNTGINNQLVNTPIQMLQGNDFTDVDERGESSTKQPNLLKETPSLMKTPKENKIDVSSETMLDTSNKNILEDQTSDVSELVEHVTKKSMSVAKTPRLCRTPRNASRSNLEKTPSEQRLDENDSDTYKQAKSSSKPLNSSRKTPRLPTPKNTVINNQLVNTPIQMLQGNDFTDVDERVESSTKQPNLLNETPSLMKTPKENKIDVSSETMLDTSNKNILEDQTSDVKKLTEHVTKKSMSIAKTPRLCRTPRNASRSHLEKTPSEPRLDENDSDTYKQAKSSSKPLNSSRKTPRLPTPKNTGINNLRVKTPMQMLQENDLTDIDEEEESSTKQPKLLQKSPGLINTPNKNVNDENLFKNDSSNITPVTESVTKERKSIRKTPRALKSPGEDFSEISNINRQVLQKLTVQTPSDFDLSNANEFKSIIDSSRKPGRPRKNLAKDNSTDIYTSKQLLYTPANNKLRENVMQSSTKLRRSFRNSSSIFKTPKIKITDSGVNNSILAVYIEDSERDFSYLDEELSRSAFYNNGQNISKTPSEFKELTRDSVFTPVMKNLTPRDNYSCLRDVKKFLPSSIKKRHSPENDLSIVKGVKQLMKTPRVRREALNDLTDVNGVKRLFNTPAIQNSPNNDLNDPKGVKQLFASSRKRQRSPVNDLLNVAGVKRLFRTPVIQNSPENDLRDVRGVRLLMGTPKIQKSPKNTLENVYGISKLFNMPKNQTLTDVSLGNIFDEKDGNSSELSTGEYYAEKSFDKLVNKKPLKTYPGKSPSPHKSISSTDKLNNMSHSTPISSPFVEQWVESVSVQNVDLTKTSKRPKRNKVSKAVHAEMKRIPNSKKVVSNLLAKKQDDEYFYQIAVVHIERLDFASNKENVNSGELPPIAAQVKRGRKHKMELSVISIDNSDTTVQNTNQMKRTTRKRGGKNIETDNLKTETSSPIGQIRKRPRKALDVNKINKDDANIKNDSDTLLEEITTSTRGRPKSNVRNALPVDNISNVNANVQEITTSTRGRPKSNVRNALPVDNISNVNANVQEIATRTRGRPKSNVRNALPVDIISNVNDNVHEITTRKRGRPKSNVGTALPADNISNVNDKMQEMQNPKHVLPRKNKERAFNASNNLSVEKPVVQSVFIPDGNLKNKKQLKLKEENKIVTTDAISSEPQKLVVQNTTDSSDEELKPKNPKDEHKIVATGTVTRRTQKRGMQAAIDIADESLKSKKTRKAKVNEVSVDESKSIKIPSAVPKPANRKVAGRNTKENADTEENSLVHGGLQPAIDIVDDSLKSKKTRKGKVNEVSVDETKSIKIQSAVPKPANRKVTGRNTKQNSGTEANSLVHGGPQAAIDIADESLKSKNTRNGKVNELSVDETTSNQIPSSVPKPTNRKVTGQNTKKNSDTEQNSIRGKRNKVRNVSFSSVEITNDKVEKIDNSKTKNTAKKTKNSNTKVKETNSADVEINDSKIRGKQTKTSDKLSIGAQEALNYKVPELPPKRGKRIQLDDHESHTSQPATKKITKPGQNVKETKKVQEPVVSNRSTRSQKQPVQIIHTKSQKPIRSKR